MADDQSMFQTISEYITTSRNLIGFWKEASALLPKGDKRDQFDEQIKAAEASLKRSDAALAKQLGYQLCQCTFPPQIMLWREQDKVWICQNPDCGRTLKPVDHRDLPRPRTDWVV